MRTTVDFNEQFCLTKEDYLSKHFDYCDWHRLYYVLQDIIKIKPNSILEIGVGASVLKGLVDAGHYMTMDINRNLCPDIVGDILDHNMELDNKFDLVICTEVLEHIQFECVSIALGNISRYLKPNGKLIVSVPHQRLYLLWMIPTNIPHVLKVPRLFLKQGIDPYHKWEIGYKGIKKEHLVKEFNQFNIKSYKCVLYADHWLLEKK